MHAFSAFASFCARVDAFVCEAVAGTGDGLAGPENVWLDGAPKIAGWGANGARHASGVVHGGGVSASGVVHGDCAVHSWAS